MASSWIFVGAVGALIVLGGAIAMVCDDWRHGERNRRELALLLPGGCLLCCVLILYVVVRLLLWLWLVPLGWLAPGWRRQLRDYFYDPLDNPAL